MRSLYFLILMSARLLLEGETAVYHVISRSAYQLHALGIEERNVFKKILRKQARFCGVEVLTYCLLENHFHLLIRIPYEDEINDLELLKRYDALYGEANNAWVMPTATLAELLGKNSDDAARVREKLTARMGNLSVFVKELKQRFGIWYNRTHSNQGTLWCRRFDSYLVEDVSRILKLVGAYIDMNPVRLNLCKKPQEYAFSGFGDASAGSEEAQDGIRGLFAGEKNWSEIRRRYGELVKDEGHQLKSVFMPLKNQTRGIIGEQNFTATWFEGHQTTLQKKPSVGHYLLCGVLYATACVLDTNSLVRQLGQRAYSQAM